MRADPMITDHQGDLFTSGAEAMVNPVNCVGRMGKGLALEFKRRKALSSTKKHFGHQPKNWHKNCDGLSML